MYWAEFVKNALNKVLISGTTDLANLNDYILLVAVKREQFYINVQGYHRFVLRPAIINHIRQLSRGSVNREKSFAVNLMIRQMVNREKCRSSARLK